MLHRVEVKGFEKGPVKRHGCPSHGVGLTPDERELWLADGANSMRPHLRRDGDAAEADREHRGARSAGLGHVQHRRTLRLSVDRRSHRHEDARRSCASLTDEERRTVQSEKVVEIVFDDGKPVRSGDQFGIGRKP